MALGMLSRLLRFALLSALTILSVGGVRTVYRNVSQNIAMKPLLLNADDPSQKTVGGLTFLGAWELGSGNNDFGGISALVALDNDRFIGVSDAGTLIGFGLTKDDRIDRPFIAAMPGAIGSDGSYEDRDSEGITYDPASKRFWVSYEGKHAIRRFTPSFARSDAIIRPEIMKRWGENSGAEAIVRLPDGRFVIFSEGMDMPGGSYMGLLYSGDPVEPGSSHFTFAYRPPEGYKATDATMLPDGRLLVLNRRISFPDGFTAKLVVLDPASIVKDATVEGEVIATLEPPLLVDNMEGLAVTQKSGRNIIWMISDNNFNILQRTILMKFALDPKPAADTKKPEAETAPGFDSL